MQSQHIFIARGILISVGVASRKNNELLVRKKKKKKPFSEGNLLALKRTRHLKDHK